ncbi:hypothetical protein N577_010390 [Lacticaseibacillus rhamnosus 2166]|nr:hypothetical protein N577_010390 [Lacticaseibacillus rhamnosus 2166]
MKKKPSVLDQLPELIADPETTGPELEILKHAEIRRQRGNNEEGIAFEIRTKLQPLAIGQKLSPKVVDFLTAISARYLGMGNRGNIIFNDNK